MLFVRIRHSETNFLLTDGQHLVSPYLVLILKNARRSEKQKKDPIIRSSLFRLPSSVLLSQDPAVQVPSALWSLTSVFGMGTGVTSTTLPLDGIHFRVCSLKTGCECMSVDLRISPRPISTGQLNASRRLHLQPINLVFYKGSYYVDRMGSLILRGASRLDAFSAYPVPT